MLAAPFALALERNFGFRFAFVGTAVAGTIWVPFWLIVTRGLAGAPREVSRPATPDTMSWFTFVQTAPVVRAIVAVFGAAPALMFVVNFTSHYLVEVWHLPNTGLARYLVIPPLLLDVGTVGFGWLATRRERDSASDTTTHVDLFLLATLLAASIALVPLARSPFTAMAICGASACGGGGIFVLTTSDMLRRVPLERTSSAGGMTAAAQSLAYIIASPLVGALIDRTRGYGAALVCLGVVVVPTSLAFVLWPSLRNAPKRTC
jgi:ACS family hexuronate transporter-like MFS transporter